MPQVKTNKANQSGTPHFVLRPCRRRYANGAIMKYLAVISIFLSLIGCATQPELVPSVYVSLTAKSSPEIEEKLRYREKIYFELGVIPADIYGSPVEEPRWYVDLNKDSAPALDVANFENQIAPFAKRYNSVNHSFPLKVAPKNTKMARVSTFGIDMDAESYRGGGIQDESGNFILLVYFDGPCSVTGEVDFGEDGIFDHQIDIPEAGLYRLTITDSSEMKIVKASQSLSQLYVVLE